MGKTLGRSAAHSIRLWTRAPGLGDGNLGIVRHAENNACGCTSPEVYQLYQKYQGRARVGRPGATGCAFGAAPDGSLRVQTQEGQEMGEDRFGRFLRLEVAGVDRRAIDLVGPSPPDIDRRFAVLEAALFPRDENRATQSRACRPVGRVMLVIERGAGAVAVANRLANFRLAKRRPIAADARLAQAVSRPRHLSPT